MGTIIAFGIFGLIVYFINTFYIGATVVGLSILGMIAYFNDASKAKPGNVISGMVLIIPIFFILIGGVLMLFGDRKADIIIKHQNSDINVVQKKINI